MPNFQIMLTQEGLSIQCSSHTVSDQMVICAISLHSSYLFRYCLYHTGTICRQYEKKRGVHSHGTANENKYVRGMWPISKVVCNDDSWNTYGQNFPNCLALPHKLHLLQISKYWIKGYKHAEGHHIQKRILLAKHKETHILEDQQKERLTKQDPNGHTPWRWRCGVKILCKLNV